MRLAYLSLKSSCAIVVSFTTNKQRNGPIVADRSSVSKCSEMAGKWWVIEHELSSRNDLCLCECGSANKQIWDPHLLQRRLNPIKWRNMEIKLIINRYVNTSLAWIRGATVARLTPDQKVACSNHVEFTIVFFINTTSIIIWFQIGLSDFQSSIIGSIGHRETTPRVAWLSTTAFEKSEIHWESKHR